MWTEMLCFLFGILVWDDWRDFTSTMCTYIYIYIYML